MSVTSINTDIPGQIGVPNRVRLMRIICTDELADITTADYLNSTNLEGYNVVTNDIFEVIYGASSNTLGLFLASVDDSGIVTLTEAPLPSNTVSISGATVSGNMPRFNNTSGQLIDSGAKVLAGVTGTYVTGLDSTSYGAAVIVTSTNDVSIVNAVPSTNTLTISFSADPGASTTVSYVYTTAALS